MDDRSGEAQEGIGNALTAADDPEIDPERIMIEIREQISGIRKDLSFDDRSFPSFGAATYPDKPDDITYDLELYQHLNLVNQEWSQTGTTFDLKESAFSRLPILGDLWRALQLRMHGPALFYANRVAERQMAINGEVVEVLNRLVATSQGQQREINTLREELKKLRPKQ